jgi:O-antigen ligase
MAPFLTAKTKDFRDEFAWVLIAVMVSAFVSLVLSWQLGFLLLFFLAAAWWVWENPEEGLVLFILIAPILPMLKITQTIGTATLVKDVIILTLFTKTFAWPLVAKKLPYRRNIFLWPVVMLLAWTAFETLRADELVLGILRARDIVLYMLLYVSVLYLPHSRRIMKERVMWAAAGLVVVILLGLYQWFFAADSAVLRYDPVREVWIPRLSSIMAHPSIFGQYLVVAAMLALAVVAEYKKSRWGVIWSVLLLALLPLIFITYSRAVWIGLLVGGVVMLFVFLSQEIVKKVPRRLVIKSVLIMIGAVVLVSVVALKFTPAVTYIKSAIDPSYGSNEERLIFLARLVGPMTDTEALIGKGLGDVLAQNFRQVDLGVYDIAAGSSRNVQLTKNRTLVDNQYLKSFVEMGLVGLLIYACLFWVFLKSAAVGLNKAPSHIKVIKLWGVGFLAAFVVQGFFIDIWDIFPTNALFWVVAALMSVSVDQGLSGKFKADN